MAGGYAGKILKVNLSDGKIDSIPTSKYEEFGGGLGIGAARTLYTRLTHA
jgi:aldehyde:ferredoxin oxidoreductase